MLSLFCLQSQLSSDLIFVLIHELFHPILSLYASDEDD